jgi:hypothetical protein
VSTASEFPFETIYCVNHPDRASIEQCEVCQKPLCGYCLYYTADGQRLCKDHALQAEAQGVQVIPPAVYAAGIIPAQARAAESSEANPFEQVVGAKNKRGTIAGKSVLYHANNNDLTAFVGLIASIFAVVSICSSGMCLPIFGILLSILALLNAKDAVDPKRTRQQAFIGLGISGLFILGIVACIGIYAAVIVGAINSSSNSNFYFSTPYTPFGFPTHTVAPIATSTPSPTPDQVVPPTKAPTDEATPAQKPFAEVSTQIFWWERVQLALAEFAPYRAGQAGHPLVINAPPAGNDIRRCAGLGHPH